MRKIFFLLFTFIIMFNYKVNATIDGLQPIDGITTFDVIKMVVYLIVILLLIYYIFWFIKKKKKFISSSLFKNYGGYPLGQNKSIQIVEIGNKIYILGVSGEINLINILESEEDIKAIKRSTISDNRQGNISKLFNRQNNTKQFEMELAEKFDQLIEKRTYSINNLLDEKEGITEKRD